MRVLVTGAAGQDGTLLRALLRERGDEVVGVVRPCPGAPGRETDVRPLDLTDAPLLERLIAELRPDRIFHLAAAHQSSEQRADLALEREMIAVNFRAVESILATVAATCPACRVFVAGSSQMFTPPPEGERRIDEATAMSPATFYGRTKAWSRELVHHYRDRHGIHAGMGILFNHESPIRRPHFLSRKVTLAAAAAAAGHPQRLRILDVNARVDWSSAADVARGIHLMLEADDPQDYVFASGEPHSVHDLLETAFRAVGLDWREHTELVANPGAPRGVLVGDPARARREIGWEVGQSFEALITEMVAADRQRLEPAVRDHAGAPAAR